MFRIWSSYCSYISILFFIATIYLHTSTLITAQTQSGARLVTNIRNQISLTNGIVHLTLSLNGEIISIGYGGLLNILAEKEVGDYSGSGGQPGDRAYYDFVGNFTASPAITYERFSGGSWKITENTNDRVTVQFLRKFLLSDTSAAVPADIFVYYSVARGVSGIYSWTIVDHRASMPSAAMFEVRFIMKLRGESFVYATVADDRSREMPQWSDVGPAASQPTLIPEARRILRPRNKKFRFEFDHKYHYLVPVSDQLAYGWRSNASTQLGVWVVSPRKEEYCPGGPRKQHLTVQTGPFLINSFQSRHIGTPAARLAKGSDWSKTYGPWLIYLNRGNPKRVSLWEDAKRAAANEARAWPYRWAATRGPSSAYPGIDDRGSVTGKLVVKDRFVDLSKIDLRKAWIGLSRQGGSPGSWSLTTDYYQFWAHPGIDGSFSLNAVRSGKYSLHGYVPGIIGDFLRKGIVKVTRGLKLRVGDVVFKPPRSGKTIWEIGYPDRDAAEFFVPILNSKSQFPYPAYGRNRFRNYGVWFAYSKAFPTRDPVFTIGKSKASIHWWYVQPNRLLKNGSYVPTTWTVAFQLNSAPRIKEHYFLRLAMASQHYAKVEVRVNSMRTSSIYNTTSCSCTVAYTDNAMARGTSYGQYTLHNIPISGRMLKKGGNRLFLTQTQGGSPYINVMYDYIRLEATTS